MNAELHPWTDRACGTLVGSAVGDAMGWPHERRDRTRSPLSPRQVSGRFVAWRRTAGSRFRPIVEDVGPGEYSDDTQTLIAVARARLTAGDQWLSWLQRVEWPFLLYYERGAGAAVKRACRAWEKQGAAWGNRAEDQARYFAAGANGAAMRIAPHVVVHHEDTFGVLAHDVVLDAATTHGHPRALLGALVHAYALWASLRQPAPLAYGWLVEAVLDGLKDWREPVWQGLDRRWLAAASQAFPDGYERAWEETVQEVEELLGSARASLESGALSAPSAFLETHGLTRTRTRGSGTLCAVAAMYLAARSASSPERGIGVPARQEGADTDTLASMTAGLLGAGLGQEWLGSYGRSVQDAPLLKALAENLLRPVLEPLTPPSSDEAGQTRSRFLDRLDAADIGTGLLLPDRREARVVSRGVLMTGNWSAHRAHLTTADGQNLFLIRGMRRVEAGDEVPRAEAPVDIENQSPVQARLQGAYLPVTDIGRVSEVLTALGMTTSSRGKDWVSYENLVIRQWYHKERATDVPGAQLRVAVSDVRAVWNRLHGMGFDGAVQRDGTAFWLRIDPYLVISVNNDEPPAG
ncbi:ADP-ribosylglycohydrolase family protein [Streptomyces sp. SHP 1-2]|uniref:ADP-ribosylglycohydrolase family protein n=1 Tax=Streptomyces sp. SHP 1-2 TaxID=2769489 RepID=UPI0022382954|nr:ADP-ribosylglycohydrolase family protein [Streptomyces sp. SHP 1-2]MCW5254535.1 ADP-ribosylglycohydrolase family protein [Streptomyces sp. SHP 1-2]